MGEFTVIGLRVVREAARAGSFSRAAERLDYTQSAVSRQVTLMEQAAGRPLFERLPRGVRPTEAGRIVVRQAETVLDALDAAREELREVRRPVGRVRVGAFATATAALVPRAIAAATQRFPGLEVRLREGTSPSLLAALERGRIDLAVLTGVHELPDGVSSTPLLDDSLFIAVHATHRLTGRSSVPVDELRTERWIAGSEDQGSTLLGAWSDAHWNPVIAHIARDWVTKLGLVAAGLGITVIPGLTVSTLPPALSIVRIDDARAIRPTVLAHRTGNAGHPLAEALHDSAAELAAEARHRLRD
ncbi:LysR substrate-binding domain-containing protein [Nocardia sp. NPDC051832]|uniref:LysR family transcriptional regulator n=1 Tax=Nocardia sp. NPDC051832 TaxID=3155673 RepID=UPI00343FB95F